MKTHRPCAILAPVALILAGCGSSDAAPPPSVEASGTAVASWDATDACALLDKAAVGAALNDPVTETSLAFVREASGADAATSECTYRLTSGGAARLMVRNSPIADNTPEAIAVTRKGTEQTIAAFSDEKVEEVPGLGIAAFFVPRVNQMNVYLDSKRFLILTVDTAPAETANTIAVDLARQISR